MKWLIVDRLTRATLITFRTAILNKDFKTYVDSKAITLKP